MMRTQFRFGLLALGVLSLASTSLVGCSGDDGKAGAQGLQGDQGPAGADGTAYTMDFADVSVPVTDAEKRQNRAPGEVTIDGTTYAIGYRSLVRTNQQLPLLGNESQTATFGLIVDRNGDALKAADGSDFVCTNGSGPDHTSLLSFGSNLFAVTQLECSTGGAYVTKLAQDVASGELTAVATRPVDFSGVFGDYVSCAGMTTPWGTHLGSEEYEPPMALFNASPAVTPFWFGDTASDGWHDVHIAAIAAYNGVANTATNAAHIGYYYGWIPEISITSADGDTDVVKHYALGRFAHELAYVMPDERTVYLSDDGTNVGLFMFVADAARDLSAGTLYAARWIQESAGNGGAASLQWVDLGHASNATIQSALNDSTVTFDTMWSKEAINADGSCPTAGFMPTNTYDVGKLCVKLKAGMDTLASRLETRLYAAYKGATTEFRKEEGITFDPDHGVLYVAMSQVAKGMEDGSSSDVGGRNDIRLPKNSCGVVYGLDVQNDAVDAGGAAIGSDYVVQNMYGVVVGEPVDYTGTVYEGNDCSVNGIANPDNVTYLPRYGILAIGEDTDSHQNDFLWSYDVRLGTLTRIATTPYGSETTSPFWHTNVNGFGYLTMVTQHPYGETDADKAANAADLESYVGYIGPFPPLQ